jgi:transcriptional regulator with XRE-family HTH domain
MLLFFSAAGQEERRMHRWWIWIVVLAAPDVPLNDDLRHLAAAVRQLRTSRGLTQREFGRRCGLTQPDVSKLERGRLMLSAAVLVRMARTFDVSLDVLCGLSQVPTSLQADVLALAQLPPDIRQDLQRYLRSLARRLRRRGGAS